MTGRSAAIAEVCTALALDDLGGARSVLLRDYPFKPEAITKRNYGPSESTRVFIRDGFIDRYTGDRLIYPPVLRVLSVVLPDEFPYHPNWKTELTHPAYWEVAPRLIT